MGGSIVKHAQEYKQLSDSARRHASEEHSAILKAQWEFLAQLYMRLAERPNQIDDKEIFGDPIPWDRGRH